MTASRRSCIPTASWTKRALPKLSGIDPVYPLTEGLALGLAPPRDRAGAAETAGAAGMDQPEVIRRCKFPPVAEALHRVHVPVELTDILPDGPFWSRLAFDELLAGQLALALIRAQLRRPAGDRNAGDGHLRNRIIDALPYALTASQRAAMAAISEDLLQPVRMLRLLQGDVGSGKTVVALLAAAAVTEAGRQAALMAPTEILARQHIKTIAPLAERAGLARRDPDRPRKGKERRELLARLEAGEIDLLVGTHALIQDDVDLQGAGARDRRRAASLRRARAAGADLEGRSRRRAGAERDADPAHAGADLFRRHGRLRSCAKSRPAASRSTPARCRLSRIERGDRRRRPRAARRASCVYWICPLVEESEAEGTEHLTNADQDGSSALQQRFGDRVGLVHGQMKGTEKDAVMAQFAAREIGLLVATTVVEVGVDVPAATIMVIENAERLRARATAPAARPDRARLGSLDLPAALPGAARRNVEGAPEGDPRDHRRIPDRRGRPETARRRRRARHPPERPARLPHRAPRGARPAHQRRRATEALRIMKDNPKLKGERAARRCAACSICSSATRRCR